MACEFDDKSKCCVTSDVKMCVLGEKIFEMHFFRQKTWKKVTQLRIFRIIPVVARPSWLHIHILAAKFWVVLESQVSVSSHGKNFQFCQQGFFYYRFQWLDFLESSNRKPTVSWLPSMKPPIESNWNDQNLGYQLGSSVLRHPKKKS